MAAHAFTADRRNVISIVALAGAAGAMALSGNSVAQPAVNFTDWLEAKSTFEAHRAAELAYHQNVMLPAYRISDAGGAKPYSIEVQMDHLEDLRCDAEKALILTPAPTLAEAVWKLEYGHQRWAEESGWPDDWWAAVIADLKRLAKG